MEIRHILGFAALLLFLVYFIKERCSARSYLLFVLMCLPLMDLNLTPETFGSITVFDLVTYITLPFVANKFLFPTPAHRTYSFLCWLLAILLITSCLHSEFIGNSLINLLKLLSIFVYGKLFIEEVKQDPSFVKVAINTLKVVSLFSILFLLVQLKTGIRFTFYSDLNPNIFDSAGIRYPGFFQDPQMFAQFLAISSFLFLIRTNSGKKYNYMGPVFFMLVILAIFLTGGRSAFLGLCLGTIFIIITGRPSYRIAAIFAILVGFVLLQALPGSINLLNRQENLNEALEIRSSIWKDAFKIFNTNVLFGIGVGNYQKFVISHSLGGYYIIDGEVVYYGTESGYIKLLIEFGILGFIPAIAFIVLPVAVAIRGYIKKISNVNTVFLVAGVLAWMTAYTSLNSLSDKRIVILLGTIISLLIVSSKRLNTINEQ